MADNFELQLDTTGPSIDIYMPSYTTSEPYNEIVVQGSEPLAPWQDFYFIDSAGARHDFIFAHDGDRFVGLVRFNQMAIGVATFYAQVRDEVFNPSPLKTKSINVIQSAHMMVSGEATMRSLEVSALVQDVDSDMKTREIEVSVA